MKKILLIIVAVVLTFTSACEKEKNYIYKKQDFKLFTPKIVNGKIELRWSQLGISEFGGSYKIYFGYTSNILNNDDYIVSGEELETVYERRQTSILLNKTYEFSILSQQDYLLYFTVASGNIISNRQYVYLNNNQLVPVDIYN
jgi:hypothetical protein